MEFYSNKRLLWRNLLGSLFTLVFTSVVIGMLFSEQNGASPLAFKLISLLVVLVFVGVGLFGLITSLGWLLTKKPMLEINKYEVVLRKQPWQEARLPASKIISVRHQLASRTSTRSGRTETDYRSQLLVKAENQPTVTLEMHLLAGTVDDIYEAVAKYLPHATWHD